MTERNWAKKQGLKLEYLLSQSKIARQLEQGRGSKDKLNVPSHALSSLESLWEENSCLTIT
jgi:hypothetical protein